jgi:FkbM family methyltransferase
MKRPFVLSLIPPYLRESIVSRIYLEKYDNYRPLYEISSLRFCPLVSMFNLIPGDIISGNIAFNGFYELKLTIELAKLSREGTVFVDVGANMGYFSLLWASLNQRARVFAFEAAPRNIKLLEHNIVKNMLDDRVTVVPKAAGNHSGTVHFNIGPADQTGWGGISTEPSSNNVEVPVVRLDEELPGITIDVLKIDVEGADTWVLYGCEQLLKRKLIRKIFFEQNNARMAELGIGLNEARDFLASVGYTCTLFGPSDGDWVAYPDSQPRPNQDEALP